MTTTLRTKPNHAQTGAFIAPAVGVAGAGAFMLHDGVAEAVLTASAGLASAVPLACAARRHNLREALEKNVVTALASTLGHTRPSRDKFRFQGWKRLESNVFGSVFTGDPGAPRKIVLRYARGLEISQATLTTIYRILRRELGPEYRVEKHDVRKKRLVMVLEETRAEDAADVSKAREVLQELMGETINVSVESDAEGPVLIEVDGLPATRMAVGNRTRTVERVLAARLGTRMQAKWNMAEATVSFTRRPKMPSLIPPPVEHAPLAIDHKSYYDLVVPMGEDEYRNVYCWHPRKQAHGLIVGGTGTGKTVTLHQATEWLTQAGVRVWILDGKKIEFTGFRGWPNVEVIASRTEHQIRMLLQLHDLMEERYDAQEAGLEGPQHWEPVFVIIDEVTSFLQNAEAWWKLHRPDKSPMKAPFLGILANLLRLARSAKIHLLVGMQRPDASIISGEARDNFGFRMSLGRLGPQGSIMVWDNPATGVSVPIDAKGRAMISTDGGEIREIQTYFAPNPEKTSDNFDEERVAAVTPLETYYERRMYEILVPEADPETGEPKRPEYKEYASAKLIPWDEDYIRQRTPKRKTDSILAPRIKDPSTANAPERATARVAVLEAEEDIHVWTPAEESEDEFDGYLEEDSAQIEDLQVGDVIQSGDGTDSWAVVQGVEMRDDQTLLDLVDFYTTYPTCLELPSDDWVTYRRPKEITEDQS
jgi:DNA segregation ATPase FtsK/SpoIIIE, S-DNA-T family